MTLVDFAPSTTAPFQFLAALSNGQQYTIAVPWNPFGERWYVTVSDLSNNVIVHRALSQSGPVFRAVLTWSDGVATAVLTAPHNIRIGELVSARVAQTDTAFDGFYPMLAVDAQTLRFDMAANPNEMTPVTGKLDFPLDLLAGYGIGSLFFHADTAQFEF